MIGEGLRTMEATILYRDLPLVQFKVEKEELLWIQVYDENRRYFPIEFMFTDKITLSDINAFISARIVPRERVNILELLESLGLQEYRWETIIKRVNGLCTDDCYWFRFPGDTRTYDEVKIRD